jgi:hypothetical protein
MKLRFFYFILIMLMIAQSVMAAGVPTNLSLSATKTTITVEWSGDSDADNYFVYWGTSSGSLTNRTSVDDSLREYTITGLDSATTYYVAVSSYDNGDESDQSDIESISTLEDTGIPSTPTGFFTTGETGIRENAVTLKWDKNSESDLDHYNIYYSLTSGSDDNVVESYDANASGFSVSGLMSSVRYYFSITAVDTSDNESEKSDELIVDTLIDTLPPNAPKEISGLLSGTHSVTITIINGNSQMADFAGNIIYYGIDAGKLDSSLDIGNSFSYIIDDLPIGATGYFAASSYDFSGNESAATDEINVTVEETTRFLNQPDDFDGGCFIGSSAGESHIPFHILFLLIPWLFVFLKRNMMPLKVHMIFLTAAFCIFSSGDSFANDPPEMPGNNLAGVSVGYSIASESDFADYYGDNTFPVYGFYERFFSEHFSLGFESGFMKEKGYLLTESGDETKIRSKITLVPVSSSIKFNMKILPFVVGYIGAGPDYWYCQEETDEKDIHPEVEEWVGGYHASAGIRLYNTDKSFKGTGALLESTYSRIDRFGDNNTDIGGWAFKFGIFYHF